MKVKEVDRRGRRKKTSDEICILYLEGVWVIIKKKVYLTARKKSRPVESEERDCGLARLKLTQKYNIFVA